MRRSRQPVIVEELGNGLAGILVGALFGLVPSSLASAGIVTLGLAYALLVLCWCIVAILLLLVPSLRALRWRWKMAILSGATLSLVLAGLYEAKRAPQPPKPATSSVSPTIYVDCAPSPFPRRMPPSGRISIVMLTGESEENMPGGLAEQIAPAGSPIRVGKSETVLTCAATTQADAPLSSITLTGHTWYQSRQQGAPPNSFLPRNYSFFITYLSPGPDKPFIFYVRNYTTVVAQFQLQSYGYARIGNDPTIRRVSVVEPVGLTNTSLFPAPPGVAIKFGKL